MSTTFWKPGSALSTTDDSTLEQKSPSTSTSKLSKSVMNMKFMKRKQAQVEQAAQDNQKRKDLLEARWVSSSASATSRGDCDRVESNSNENKRFTCTKETFDPLVLLPGRRSFGGFNRHVELNYQRIVDIARFNQLTADVEKDAVDDEEMVGRYQELIGLPRGPNQGRKAPPQKRLNKDDKSSSKRSKHTRKIQ